ncbi:MAG: glycosyltransferase [Chloroflexota bacterium]|nr:glycosyltransferase [Chloroflexota bacterium]
MTAEPRLSLVIPAYNETENLGGGVLQQVADYLGGQSYPSEVLIADDGSEDETACLVEEFARQHPSFSLLRGEHQGKALTVRRGVLAARGRYVLFADLDLSTPLTYVEPFLALLDEGWDIVIASREARGGARLGAPLLRRLMARGFSLLVRSLLLPGIHDSQCGFKAFRREVGQDLFSSLRVFQPEAGVVRGPRVTAFDVELLLLAHKKGYTIKEVPVLWHHRETRRVNPLLDSSRMFREVLTIWWNNRRGVYDRAG